MRRPVSPARAAVAFAAAASIAGAAYGFSAANTVPPSSAGAGAGTVSGYAVSNVHYTLDTTAPDHVDSLTFTITPPLPGGQGTVIAAATLSHGGPSAYTCSADPSGDTVTCPTTSPQLVAGELAALTVVAAR
jgi:hypothetical protein